jgi:hypothetical protein
MNWVKSYSFLAFPVLGLVLIAGLIHFALFDGIHVGEARGVVKKVYIKSYPGWRVGGSSLHKAKIELENGDVVAVVCEIHCKYGLRIKVQVYEPIFSTNKVYIYKNIYPY